MTRTATATWLVLTLCAGLSDWACKPSSATDAPPRSSSAAPVLSAYPLAVEPANVGTYPAVTNSGAGYFYDDVLEYRVWVHPAAGGDDTYQAFATLEQAQDYSRRVSGAEEPLALVLQREWLDEPSPGEFVHKKGERITEWQTEWLDAKNRRTQGAIEKFLSERRGRTRG